MSKKSRMGRRVTSAIMAILLTLSALTFTSTIVLKNTLLSDTYFRAELNEQNFSEQVTEALTTQYGSSLAAIGLDPQSIQDSITTPIANAAADLVVTALYHSDQLAAREETTATNLNQSIMSFLTKWSPNFASLAQSTVASAVNTMISAIHSALKLDELQALGKTIGALQGITTFLLSISSILGIICLFYLLLVASYKSVLMPFLICGIVLGVISAIGFFLPIASLANYPEFITDFCIQYQKSVSASIGYAALFNGCAAVIFSIISMALRKAIRHS